MQLVEKNSEIIFSKADLMDPNHVQTINWSQDLKDRTENFVQLMATLASDKNSQVMFFVQKSLTDKLLSVSTQTDNNKGDEYVTTVQPRMFRYGQDSSTQTTFRFLVYVDPLYNIYQHRFINQATVSKLAAIANKVPDLVPYAAEAKKLIGVAQSVFGDPLRTFEG